MNLLSLLLSGALLTANRSETMSPLDRPFAQPVKVVFSGSNRIHAGITTPALQLISAVSRKTHGAAGTFDIPLPCSEDTGTSTPYLLGTFFDGAGGSPYSLTVVSSNDGYNWKLVKAHAYVPSAGEIRDPSVIKIGETLWCVYTSGTYGLVDYFSLIKSTDGGLSWTFVQTITSVSGATHTWAPEWFRDSDKSVHVQVSISTDHYGEGGTINIYELHPMTSDPSGTWSAAVSTPIPTWNSDAYDPSTIKVGNTYYTLATISVRVRLLIGDTTGNGSVNSSDLDETKLRSGQTADNNNFRADTTTDGAINASDSALIKLHSGEALSASFPHPTK